MTCTRRQNQSNARLRLYFRQLYAVYFLLALLSISPFAFPREEQDQAETCLQALQSDRFFAILHAFADGQVVDIANPEQRELFELYRLMYLGDPGTQLPADMYDTLSGNLKKHPFLAKLKMKKYEVMTAGFRLGESPALQKFIDLEQRSAGKTLATFLQVEANIGNWFKFLQLEGSQPSGASGKLLVVREELQRLGVDAAALLNINKSELDHRQRVRVIYEGLSQIREALARRGLKTQRVEQAMIDVVHAGAGTHREVQMGVRSTDPGEKLQAMRLWQKERDTIAMQLGFTGHFEELQAKFPAAYPFGRKQDLSDLLDEMEKDMRSRATHLGTATRWVRRLSLLESPLRSCLGGSDCSSRFYLTKALDPNFIYFTITDPETHASSGHATIVLGEAVNEAGQAIHVAMLDKLQNVRNEDIPWFLETVRQALKDVGYVLGIPPVGDSNGLSNDSTTRTFVDSRVKTTNQHFVQFRPHPHDYQFPNQYSRAYSELLLKALAPLNRPDLLIREIGETKEYFAPSTPKVSEITDQARALKTGTPADKIRYVEIQEVFRRSSQGQHLDPDYEETKRAWLSSPDSSVVLKRRIFLLDESRTPLNVFSDVELVDLYDVLRHQSVERLRAFADRLSRERPAALTRALKVSPLDEIKEILVGSLLAQAVDYRQLRVIWPLEFRVSLLAEYLNYRLHGGENFVEQMFSDAEMIAVFPKVLRMDRLSERLRQKQPALFSEVLKTLDFSTLIVLATSLPNLTENPTFVDIVRQWPTSQQTVLIQYIDEHKIMSETDFLTKAFTDKQLTESFRLFNPTHGQALAALLRVRPQTFINALKTQPPVHQIYLMQILHDLRGLSESSFIKNGWTERDRNELLYLIFSNKILVDKKFFGQSFSNQEILSAVKSIPLPELTEYALNASLPEEVAYQLVRHLKDRGVAISSLLRPAVFSVRAIKYLLNQRIDINANSVEHSTMLHFAAA